MQILPFNCSLFQIKAQDKIFSPRINNVPFAPRQASDVLTRLTVDLKL